MTQRILVVDDEANIRELVRLYLEKEGFAVDLAEDGSDALSRVREAQPALIVLDLMMPGIDGFEVCRSVRREFDIPIIMLTARNEDIDKIVGLELGADDYITKPFNPRELVARVKAILRRAEGGTRRPQAVVSAGNIEVDKARREVHI
ncbi:MAG TPA: response regulator, partial [Dehalococcoidia bacterium]|nr:response regulator [Dehalococcoidia bacterium]